MKYLGKRSLSSVMSVVLNIAWYVVLIGGIIVGIGFSLVLFSPPDIQALITDVNNDPDWQVMMNLPLILKLLVIPYEALTLILLLVIIRKCRNLFEKFRREQVFPKENVTLIREVGKFLLIFSILTFRLVVLLVSLLLLMLCEVFKERTALQEEHDLTV